MEYTFENANAVGIGVFDNDTDNLVQFRGIVSDSAALTVTLNATDNTIVLDFDDAVLVADIPDATTTQRGILETATNAEALAKAATDKILTPSNLAALGSTTTFQGFVELATNAETITGTDTDRATTPAGVAAAAALYKTVTFADAVARSGATPGFAGQFGTQLDTDQAYIANGAGAGAWTGLFTFGGTSTMSTSTTLDVNGGALTFISGTFNIDGTMTANWAGNYVFNNAVITFDNVTTLDFTADTIIQFAGISANADSLFAFDGSGLVANYEIGEFLSNFNTQTGWGTPSGTLARTTFASYAGQTISNPPTQAEVQALDDAVVIVSRRFAALITDLLAIKLPAA